MEWVEEESLLPNGISFVLVVAWIAINGMLLLNPLPKPAIIWYPTHMPALDSTSMVAIRPAAIVHMRVPTMANST